ncbi:MAG: 23S rRNA (adenine(2503)-C(2))-methyltransferase RlmN [Candidatus Aureabacteria bacterium]|nr:23S rRNA (adenine(2503)-C(2))-methyltransferase RlmN [Candidatus Auribacterota bacterium]
MTKPDLRGMTAAELAQYMVAMGEAPYRGRQVAAWLHGRGAAHAADMTDLPRALRERLAREAGVVNLELVSERQTRTGDARKYLFRLDDGETIETVFLTLETSQSVCLSSQAGCPVGCGFCATGAIGFRRNLSAGEIVDQFLKVRDRLTQGERITNIVFMGMGEPLLNFDNLARAISIFASRDGPGFSPRRVTVSTCGIVPGIHKLIAAGITPELAISIISADEEKREELFPLARTYPLHDVVEAARCYARFIRRPITFEYVILKSINDSRRDARLLGELVRSVRCKVNLIRYNPADNPRFTPGSEERAEEFRRWLRPFCAAVTVRKSKGDEIDAACGQLRAGYSKHEIRR